MDVQTYLQRIGFQATVGPDYETLRGIHRAHMLTVPFENLDLIPLHRPVKLDERSLWDKIILHRRGGFCYELNGMFAWLLKQIGFDVTHLNARVFNREGEPGIDFDHLTLLVSIPGRPGRWLADVGFGDSFMEPMNFEDGGDQAQGLRAYKLEPSSGGYVLWQRNYDKSWRREYIFDMQPRSFPRDYEAACLYHQTSPQSHFTRNSMISLAKPDGRVSLEEHEWTITKNGEKSRHPVANAQEYNTLLKEHFGVVL